MRKHLAFIVILLLTAMVRFTILFQSQTHVHNDEAIIGLMGKSILEGGYLPFYMFGQPYNAGAAWEAYVTTIPFVVFGVGVVQLKSCIVVLSLVCLVLFYRMACSLHGQRTAVLAALVFVLAPSLLKWHFQIRGYSWYFLSIPILTSLYLSIESCSSSKARRVFLFGLVSGLSVWCLELVLSVVATLWILLAIRRKLSAKSAALGFAGFVIGYAPAIVFNLTHQFSNWRFVFINKTVGGDGSSLFHSSAVTDILFQEMPKFFGPDTVLWYYPERPASGFVFYAIALTAVAVAIIPFLKTPSKIREALRGDLATNDETKDLLMLVLAAACFVPYLAAPIRVAGYFLSVWFFLSVLTGRLLKQCFNAPTMRPRVVGSILLLVILVVGIGVMVETARRNQIETLTLNKNGDNFSLTRIPGADIEAVQEHLSQHQISSIWTTVSFVHPLIFESGETLAVFNVVTWHDSKPHVRSVFVIETESPLRFDLENLCIQMAGVTPLVTEYGKLTVIEEKSRE